MCVNHVSPSLAQGHRYTLMLTTYRSALALAAVMAGLASPLSATAHNPHADHEQARKAVAAGEALPLRVVLGRIAPDYPGRVMNIQFERDDGAWIYKIRVLQKGGELLRLKVDAQTGNVIDVKRRRMRHKRKD